MRIIICLRKPMHLSTNVLRSLDDLENHWGFFLQQERALAAIGDIIEEFLICQENKRKDITFYNVTQKTT